MSKTKVLVTFTIASVLMLHTHGCGAAPLDDSLGLGQPGRISQEQFEEQQLESLKSLPVNGNIEISKSQITKIVSKTGGKTEMRQTSEEKVKDPNSGQTLARLTKERVASKAPNETKPKSMTKTELEVPSKGIHRVTVDKKMKQAPKDNSDSTELAEDYYAPFDSIQYTPIDIADYIRRTGDNDGVSMAIEELMNEGLMSKPEADAYLDEVKNEMEFQQQHFAGQMPIQTYNTPTLPHNQRFIAKNQNLNGRHAIQNPSQMSPQKQHMKFNQGPSQNHPISTNYPQAMRNKPTFNNHKKSYGPKPNFYQEEEQDENEMLIRPTGNRDIDEENDYNDLIERIRIADFLYKEYSLEEIIYQLAKDMFSQGKLKGTKDAEQSLQRFSNFLQEEAAEGRISKDLGIRVLDVVMAALVDAVGEQPPKSNERNMNPETNNRPDRHLDVPNGPNRSLVKDTPQMKANINKESVMIEKPSKTGAKSSPISVNGGATKSLDNASSKEN